MKVLNITFKSTEDNFKKEITGIKNNTVRFRDDDERFDVLDSYAKGEIDKLIINIDLKSNVFQTFMRVVRDVTVYKNLYVITWDA